MAKRNRTSFQKRNRERRKAEKAAKKRERRDQRKDELPHVPGVDTVADDALLPFTQIIREDNTGQGAPAQENS